MRAQTRYRRVLWLLGAAGLGLLGAAPANAAEDTMTASLNLSRSLPGTYTVRVTDARSFSAWVSCADLDAGVRSVRTRRGMRWLATS